MKNQMYFFFSKFLKESYNYYGIILSPRYEHKNDSIIWSIENPDNLSYTVAALSSKPHELFYDFCNITSNNDFYKSNWGKSVKFEQPERYYFLSPSDEKLLNERLKDINEIDFKDFHCDVECSYYSIWPDEDFLVEIGMKIINPINKETGESLSGESLNDGLVGLVHDDDFFNDYEYSLFSPILNVIRNNPLLFDNEFMYFTNSIDWRTPNNEPIKLQF
jgi:hypothetical protein